MKFTADDFTNLPPTFAQYVQRMYSERQRTHPTHHAALIKWAEREAAVAERCGLCQPKPADWDDD